MHNQVQNATHVQASGSASQGPVYGGNALLEMMADVRRRTYVVQDASGRHVGLSLTAPEPSTGAQTIAVLPPLYPEWLGDRSFCEVHGIRFPYVSGAMANGIATTELVIKMAKAGMLGFFGAAGLTLNRVEAAIDRLQADSQNRSGSQCCSSSAHLHSKLLRQGVFSYPLNACSVSRKDWSPVQM